MDHKSKIMETFVLDPNLIQICFDEAEKGLKNGEVPVGCLFIIEDQNGSQQILAKSHNRSNEFKSALKHAEFDCINQIVEQYPENYDEIFKKTIVVLTLEPCIMCCRALRRLQVKAVLYGAQNERFGGAGSVMSVHSNPRLNDPVLNCISGSLDAEKSIALLKRFYDQTNENAPKDKVKIKKSTSNLINDESNKNQSHSSEQSTHK